MKTAILFPGYGNYLENSGKDFYEKYSSVQDLFKEASHYLGLDCEKLCFSSSNIGLNRIEHTYLALYVIRCCIYSVLKEHNIEPDFVAGYDTGQYAALYAANSITFIEGLSLVKQYSHLYSDLLNTNEYAVLKVNGLTSTKLVQFLDSQASIASYISRTQHLLSGTREGLKEVYDKLRNASGVTLNYEDLGIGLNSHLMDPIVKKFVPHVEQVPFKELDFPLITNDNGELISSGKLVQREIIKLINSPLRWDKVIDKLSSTDRIMSILFQTEWIDLVNEKYANKHVISIEDTQDLEQISLDS